MSFWQPYFGYRPDQSHTQRFVGALPYPRLATALPHLMRQRTKRDVFLWLPLLAVKPSWRRGSQGIGDCVSWGLELACTMLMAMQHVSGQSRWVEEAATEPLYGFMRVEINGGRPRSGKTQDGAAGSHGAQAVKEFGVLCRIDYSQQTGNPEHDLRVYDGHEVDQDYGFTSKARRWGFYGAGGEFDRGALDAVAKQYPVEEVTQVRTPEEVAAAIDAGCPVSVASMVGYGNMKRNNEGIVRRSGSWAHQMMIGGVKYTPNGEPLFRIFQSWNKSCSGPDPGIEHAAISDCSWWAVADDVDRMVSQDDSFAFSRVAGFVLPPWDFARDFFV
jgi:hypothetical protein